MTPLHDRPLAGHGLTSYRHKSRYGYVMIGATDDADALREAARSLDTAPELASLDKWDGEKYVPAALLDSTAIEQNASGGAMKPGDQVEFLPPA